MARKSRRKTKTTRGARRRRAMKEAGGLSAIPVTGSGLEYLEDLERHLLEYDGLSVRLKPSFASAVADFHRAIAGTTGGGALDRELDAALTEASELNEFLGSITLKCSDRNLKENLATVDGREVLGRLSRLPLTRWNFKTDRKSTQHIGPMAQDFHAAFGVGSSDRHIGGSDADGIAFASIQALYEMVRGLEVRVEGLAPDGEKARVVGAGGEARA
jgi:hypothetical protein